MIWADFYQIQLSTCWKAKFHDGELCVILTYFTKFITHLGKGESKTRRTLHDFGRFYEIQASVCLKGKFRNGVVPDQSGEGNLKLRALV